jgi:hypothetical protein
MVPIHAPVATGNENKPDKALNSEMTIPDNCKLTTENTKNNTANTEHLLSNSSQQIFIFLNDFSIETTDDILDEDETANLSEDESLTHLKATIDRGMVTSEFRALSGLFSLPFITLALRLYWRI